MKISRSFLLSSTVFLIGVLALTAVALPKKVIHAKGDVRGHLSQLGTALMMYAQDYDEVLPPMKDAKQFQDLMRPYVKKEAYLINPRSDKPFAINSQLSGKPLIDVYRAAFKIKQPAVAIYEASPDEGGTRFVLTLPQPIMLNKDEPVWGYDGKQEPFEPKIVSVSYHEWQKLRMDAHLP